MLKRLTTILRGKISIKNSDKSNFTDPDFHTLICTDSVFATQDLHLLGL